MSTSSQPVDVLIQRAASLKRKEPRSYDVERRSEKRIDYEVTAQLRLLRDNGEVESVVNVQTVDISRGGIAVRSPRMFHTGTHGVICLVKSDGQIALVGVEVRHCKYLGNMIHQTGLQFIPSPLADDAKEVKAAS